MLTCGKMQPSSAYSGTPSIMIEMAVLIVTLCVCASRPTLSVFALSFERGSEGIVPCHSMTEGGYSAEDTEAINWYFCPKGSSDSPSSIIKYLRGVTTLPTNNQGQYSLSNTSLVIANVSYLSEGTYSYKYSPWYKALRDGFVDVSENVSCKADRPKIDGCDREKPSCEVTVPSDTADFNLVCSVKRVKPAVNISWFRWSGSEWEEINAKLQFEIDTCNAHSSNCFSYNNTFNSIATVEVSLKSKKSTFKCVTNSSELENVNMTVTKSADYGRDNLTEPTHTRSRSEEPTTPTSVVGYGHPFTYPLIAVALVIGVMGVLYISIRYSARKKTKKKEPVGLKTDYTEVECIDDVV